VGAVKLDIRYNVKLNPGLSWQKGIQQRVDLFFHQITLTFKEQTSKPLHLEYS